MFVRDSQRGCFIFVAISFSTVFQIILFGSADCFPLWNVFKSVKNDFLPLRSDSAFCRSRGKSFPIGKCKNCGKIFAQKDTNSICHLFPFSTLACVMRLALDFVPFSPVPAKKLTGPFDVVKLWGFPTRWRSPSWGFCSIYFNPVWMCWKRNVK